MFRGLLKVGLVSMLSVGGLSAKTYYTIGSLDLSNQTPNGYCEDMNGNTKQQMLQLIETKMNGKCKKEAIDSKFIETYRCDTAKGLTVIHFTEADRDMCATTNLEYLESEKNKEKQQKKEAFNKLNLSSYNEVYEGIGDTDFCRSLRQHDSESYFEYYVPSGNCPSIDKIKKVLKDREERAEKQRIASEKAKEERLVKEKAEKERIAKENAEKLALAKSKGFNSYEEYQSHLEKERIAKENAEKLALAKSKGFNSYDEYIADKQRKEKEEWAKKYPYTAILGCKTSVGTAMPAMMCLESAKLDGRFVFANHIQLQQNFNATRSSIDFGLKNNFNLEVVAQKSTFFYVKIINTLTSEEVFYDEKQNDKWGYRGTIKVKN